MVVKQEIVSAAEEDDVPQDDVDEVLPENDSNSIHAISGMKAVWEDEIADRQKKFRCGICNKGFQSSESLRVHNYNYHK